MEDAQIIALFLARDEQAIQETEKQYGHLCLHIASRILSDPQDVQECVNDAYLVLWNQIPPASPEHLQAYLCKIVRNLSLKKLSYLSAEKRSTKMTVSLEELGQLLPDPRSTDQTDAEHLGRLISDFLRTEPDDARNIFLRKYWFFDSVSDIAARSGFSENKIKSMLFRTRNRLRAYLKKEGIQV